MVLWPMLLDENCSAIVDEVVCMSLIDITQSPKRLFGIFLAPVGLLLLLVGCQLVKPLEPTAEPAVEVADADLTASVPLTEALSPVALRIPALDLELPITTMGWVVTEVDGQRTTTWVVPTDTVGWHANSAGAGGAGNTILSGYQATGAALLAPLALGDITVDQEIELTDTAGNVFRYRVTEVSDPIPLLGATEEDNTLMRSYLQPSELPILTLMTGWPDFTTTHRIFAVADYVGRVP